MSRTLQPGRTARRRWPGRRARSDADEALALAEERRGRRAWLGAASSARLADDARAIRRALRRAVHWVALAERHRRLSPGSSPLLGARPRRNSARAGDGGGGACRAGAGRGPGSRCGLFQEVICWPIWPGPVSGAGDPDRAVSAAEEAVAVARHQGAQVVECSPSSPGPGCGRRLAKPGVVRQADLDAALRLVHETGALTYESFIREELGRLHHDESELREALRLYRQIGATGHARRLEAEMSERTGP